MTNYFASSRTLDELKSAYRAAVKKWHPDLNHSPDATEMMKKINNDYEARFEELKRAHNATHDKQHQTNETADEYRRIILALIKLDGLKIELCGAWLWIGGDTQKHKDELKRLGCKWAPQKKLWSWHHETAGCSHRARGKTSMDTIRRKYGSTVVKGWQAEEQKTA